MRLHKELYSQFQSAWRHIVHLLRDSVPQIQPQVLPSAASKLKAKVIHLNDSQLLTNLKREYV